MTYAPEAIIYHGHILTLGGFLRQHFGYGRGAFRFHQARARRGSGRFIQELEFYARFPTLLRSTLSQVRGSQALYVATLLVAWQGANAAGFFWEMNHIKRAKKGKSLAT